MPLIILLTIKKGEMIMRKTFKHFLSLIAMFAFLFTLGTEAMAAKKSKTLKNTQKNYYGR